MARQSGAAATDDYGWLHELSPAQARAVTELAGGATHAEAALAAGVHRVTVSRWVTNHPAFIAELNRVRRDNFIAARKKLRELTDSALDVVATAVGDGDLEAAFRWLRLGQTVQAPEVPSGPYESKDVVEDARLHLGSGLSDLLSSFNSDRTTADAERWLGSITPRADDLGTPPS